MRLTSGRYSLALLQIYDPEHDARPTAQAEIQAKSGLTWPEAVKELLAHYGVTKAEEASSLLDRARREAELLAGTELSAVSADPPNSVVRIRYDWD